MLVTPPTPFSNIFLCSCKTPRGNLWTPSIVQHLWTISHSINLLVSRGQLTDLSPHLFGPNSRKLSNNSGIVYGNNKFNYEVAHAFNGYSLRLLHG